jgi:hypothetical protein
MRLKMAQNTQNQAQIDFASRTSDSRLNAATKRENQAEAQGSGRPFSREGVIQCAAHRVGREAPTSTALVRRRLHGPVQTATVPRAIRAPLPSFPSYDMICHKHGDGLDDG